MSAATDLAALTERVANHIKFFWVVVAFGFLWLATVSGVLWIIHGQLGGVQNAQANIPVQTVEALLSKPASTQPEMASKLGAVSTILQSAKIGQVKADKAALAKVSTQIADAQRTYPETPEVWQATSALISYKSSEASSVGIIPGSGCQFSVGDVALFKNCDISLEAALSSLSTLKINGQEPKVQFQNCVIRYSGGGVPPYSMTFMNSIFQFNVSIVPPKPGIRAMEQLTTADLGKPIEIRGE